MMTKHVALFVATAFLPFLPLHLLMGQDDGPTMPADLVVLNAKVWTVNKKQPEAEAIAVVRERIVFVGSTAAAKKWIGPKTRVLELDGKRVVPGFHDSHLLFLCSGMRLSLVALQDAADEA
jgi:predicted amidohydrolase YtcJ